MNGDRIASLRSLFRGSGSLLAGVVLLLNTGCGESQGVSDAKPDAPLHPVKGKVIGIGSGSLVNAKITFVPVQLGSGAREASGLLRADGSFDLTTAADGDGIAEGGYKIRILPPPTTPGVKAPRSPIPDHYLDEDGSGLKATITASTVDLPPIKLSQQSAHNRDRD